jgi:Coenzyme PQQ synthesis protein D (PqqD)
VRADDRSPVRPRARKKRLVVLQQDEETLVYDLESHQAHCLNRAVEAVWRLCDGRRTVPEITRALRRELPAPLGSEVVLLALDQLRAANLLVNAGEKTEPAGGPSRRELLARLGKGAVAALPLVTSVVAPRAVHAASPTCAAGIDINVNLCKSDDPIYLGCCCTDKGNICINTGGNQDCKGAFC